jgi:hypothetical protein
MAGDRSVLKRHSAHVSSHASRVRIVPSEEIGEAVDEMEMLFPHEAVLEAPMGCPHVCVYTSTAPASLIDERIREHRREVEHLPNF